MKKLALTAAGLCLGLGIVTTQAADTGLLALVEVDSSSSYAAGLAGINAAAKTANCALVREGSIVNENGNMDIDQPDRFLYLRCASPVIAANKTGLINPLKALGDKVALAEGPLASVDGPGDAASGAGRAYILKLATYNNDDPAKRDRDLLAIGKKVKPLPDRYKNEAFIRVHDALGMKRPDEAVVIYYDTPEQGERFRNSNGDILKAIGAFNDDHLEDFVYFGGKGHQ